MNQATWDLLKPLLGQAARDVLRTVGMYLAAKGLIQGDAGVTAFIGAGMTLAGLFWGWFTTTGYLKVAGLLKKLTDTHTQAAAVVVAKQMAPAAVSGIAVDAKADIAAVAKVVLVGLMLGALAFPDLAHAQIKLKSPGQIVSDIKAATGQTTLAATASTGVTSFDTAFSKLTGKINEITKDLADKAIADLNAAITDATNNHDAISLPCWQANLSIIQSLPAEWPTPPTVIGVALLIQIQRDLLNNITGNQGTSLKVACAALWGDELQIVGQMSLLLGLGAL